MKINEQLKEKYQWGEDARWESRAKRIGRMVAPNTKVLDLGGGLGGLFKYLNNCEYSVIDLEAWTDKTVIADFNKNEFPDMPETQYVICQGVLEYIKEPLEFLKQIKKYAPILILTYRLDSGAKTPIERANAIRFDVLDIALQKAGWDIMADKMFSPVQKLYYCSRQ